MYLFICAPPYFHSRYQNITGYQPAHADVYNRALFLRAPVKESKQAIRAVFPKGGSLRAKARKLLNVVRFA
jgi:hypothetical protein